MKRWKRLGGGLVGGMLCLPLSVSAGQASLADAAKRGDTIAVDRALRARVDINAPAADGSTALHWAAYRDDAGLVRKLLNAGAQSQVLNRYGVTPLALAATHGSSAIVSMLLKAGADPNAASPEGETPLMLAARSGSVAAIGALIEHGANVNARESWREQTALMWAAAEGHVAALEALLAAGADIRARSKRGFTAFLFAVREGRIDAAQQLLASGANVDDTLIETAGSREAVAADDGSTTSKSGPSALLLAVGNGHFELASRLLDGGANPSFAPQGWTALHELSWVRKPGQASNSPAPVGSGTLDSLEIARRLIEHGAALNARANGRAKETTMTWLNLNGGTPFFFAARTCDVKLMRLLVEAGADPRLPNEDDTTPLMAAAGLGTRSAGEDAGTEPECVQAVTLTLAAGNDVNAVDALDNTAMHGAAMKHMPSVVTLLSERGAKVEVWNRKNSRGWTPLRIAAGVYFSANFRFDVPTRDAIRTTMVAAGVPAEIEAGTTVTAAVPIE